MNLSLPRYSDDEVAVFHPIFKYCAEEAIKQLNKQNDLQVVHHRSFNGITVDYSIERKNNKKIILLIEIKRTSNAVESTRYRYQALSYRKEADYLCETKYYILTNLEKTELFKYDASKPRVSSQILQGSPLVAGNFRTTSPKIFFRILINHIQNILEMALNDTGKYDNNLDALYNLLIGKIDDYENWHKLLMPFSYEYIRGSAHNYINLLNKIKTIRWKAADAYISQPQRLSDKGALINFMHVFKKPYPKSSDINAFNQNLLENAFKNGHSRGKAEDISEIIYDLLTPKGPGIVETDEELARLLAILAKHSLNQPLQENEKIADPAAGSGRLLTSAIDTCFSKLSSQSVWANEIEKHFAEILSLRLGLCFAESISAENSPRITLNDICDLSQKDFKNVKVTFLNPPYISGIYSKKYRAAISKAIEKTTNRASKTNIGKIGLEIPFLELIVTLTNQQSVIATIMPYTSLTRKSKEITNFRKYLLNSFGLEMIVTYPRSGLFENVLKRTCILIGKKGHATKAVNWLNINVPIERIDTNELMHSLKLNSSGRSFSITPYSYDSLNKTLTDGWIHDTKKISKQWFLNLMGKESFNVSQYVSKIKRGTSGNSGSSDLSAISKKHENLIEIIPPKYRLNAINNSDKMKKFLDNYNSPCISPLLEKDKSLNEQNEYVDKLINSYLDFKKNNQKDNKQQKLPLSLQKVFRSLIKDVKTFAPNSILLPRAIRVVGSIGICLTRYNISTNFMVITCPNKKEAVLLASWLYSVFGQIQMEFLSNDQEGLRKLEKNETIQLLAPSILKNLTPKIFDRIYNAFKNSEALNFRSIQVRNIDKVWAEIISKNPNSLLSEAFALLIDLVDERAP